MNSQPLKMIPTELLNRAINYMATSIGHTFADTQALLQEMNSLPDVPEVKEEKKDK